jgi:hypothetical protein
VQALLTDRSSQLSWLAGFAPESGGLALYVGAFALAPLTLVQSISAGGIGVLAFASESQATQIPRTAIFLKTCGAATVLSG